MSSKTSRLKKNVDLVNYIKGELKSLGYYKVEISEWEENIIKVNADGDLNNISVNFHCSHETINLKDIPKVELKEISQSAKSHERDPWYAQIICNKEKDTPEKVEWVNILKLDF